jgi:TRAP-type C4-dicarboxylate transport system permease small subunit
MIINRFYFVLKTLRTAEQWLCLLAFLALTSVLFADVVWREVTGSGLHWASEVGLFANTLLVMAGFGLASAQGAHLRPRFSDSWLPASWEPHLVRLGYLLTAIFCGVLCFYAVLMVADTASFGERSVRLGWPVWLAQMILPLAFASAVLRHLSFALWPALAPSPHQVPEE